MTSRTIPEHWIERLFEKMSAIYGARFSDMWRDTPNLQDVKDTWRQGLADQNDAALKRGFAALFHEKTPPTLPRFIELCAAPPAMYTTHQFAAITHEHRVTDTGEDHLAKIRALLKPIAERVEVPRGFTGIEWAFRILREADVNAKIPLHKLSFANDAINRWCISHHCTREDLDENGKWMRTVPSSLVKKDEVELPPLVPSPHIYTGEEAMREPGMDDE